MGIHVATTSYKAATLRALIDPKETITQLDTKCIMSTSHSFSKSSSSGSYFGHSAFTYVLRGFISFCSNVTNSVTNSVTNCLYSFYCHYLLLVYYFKCLLITSTFTALLHLLIESY